MSPTQDSPLLPSAEKIAPSRRQVLQYYFQLTRLHKWPLGNVLIIWPCLWAIQMVGYSNGLPVQSLARETLVFSLGSTLLHSAACVINDICDRDFDAQVERTKTRPLVTGAVSLRGAWFLLFLLVSSTLYLLSFANSTAILCGLFGVFPLHALYPLMKRWTWWPQAWLGLAMNWGFPTAWLYLSPDISSLNAVYVIFPGLVCWTIVYDTIYSCQDRKDDVKAGIKSTGVLFGDWVRAILALFSTAFVACLVAAGFVNQQGLYYFIVSCAGTALHLTWQLTTWDVDSARDCGAKFKVSSRYQ
ncbi:UbiA prenyltransferase family [Mucidula mucida]|nr:UbiA prenyltransferase family [Mucidula mucida]